MLGGVFERCTDVGHQLRKNVKDNVKESCRKSAFQTQSIVKMFSTQINKKKS